MQNRRLTTVFLLLSLPLACFDPGDPQETGSNGEGSTTTTSGAASVTEGADTSGGTIGPATTLASQTSTGGNDSIGSTEDPGTATTGGATCAGHCTPPVPAGFHGPVFVANTSEDPPPCPAEAPVAVADLHTGLIAPLAECTCECGDPTGLSCSATTLTARGSNCFQPALDPDTWTLEPGNCVPHFSSSEAFSASVPTLDTAGGTCAVSDGETVSPAGWENNLRLCEAQVDADGCDGERPCVDTPSEYYGQLCVYVEGEATCPNEGWEVQEVAYEGIDDDRSCTSCSCGDPQGSCGGTVHLTETGCGAGSFLTDTVDVGACADANTSAATHAQYTPQIDAACAPIGGEAQGEAAGAGMVTLCCLSILK